MAHAVERSHAGSDLRSVVIGALVPWVVFLVSVPTASAFVDDRSVDVREFLSAALVYLGFVALPSLLPVAAARAGAMRMAATLLMAVVAGVAGVLIVTTDDAQAGLAVLVVPYVAVPLALLLLVLRALINRGHAAREPGMDLGGF